VRRARARAAARRVALGAAALLSALSRVCPRLTQRRADRRDAAAAARRADTQATGRLAQALAATQGSLRKPASQEYHESLKQVQAALAAASMEAPPRGAGCDEHLRVGSAGGGAGMRGAAALAAMRAAQANPAPSQRFAAGSCPPLVGVHAWAAQFEERCVLRDARPHRLRAACFAVPAQR
jgi:hypothetical protein